ncbi:hypothetical protein FDJ44_gp01 [Microbacterium phage Pikmin]|uniref:Uncharacterized protein n=3 Tax=Pikminvirus pikmin TaxID=2560596 RepID=A0A2P1CKB5_9CAUD|nr:hypothetical protein FDJ44_gp01 [Microbacterium phage Pikmin]AVJ50992.1 hypothetical protein PBI_PAJAZA_1 [Microbacterium phage Pajaza]AVJ51139.1 hypothetical protein PBI_PIKMIN_1 [Microbacterium phage Pikmin]AVJ51697.1 hypothetical protein PBI_CASEY_1 [Microbacterium phage Casey]
MPPSQRKPKTAGAAQSASASKRARCKALTTSGSPCKRPAQPGLTVCKSHGGGTAASVRKSKKAVVSQQAAQLWGISADTSGLSIEGELTRLARNKLTDITAIRIELSSSPDEYYGLLTDGYEVTDSDLNGRTVKKSKKSGVHPLVQELHKAENELVAILRLLQEVTGGSEEVDTKRLRIQTAREAARLLKAFPGISVDDVAAEVSKNA